MVDRETLERRLRVLAELDGKLRGFASIPEDEFIASDPLHDLTWKVIQNDLDDLGEFRAAVASLL